MSAVPLKESIETTTAKAIRRQLAAAIKDDFGTKDLVIFGRISSLMYILYSLNSREGQS